MTAQAMSHRSQTGLSDRRRGVPTHRPIVDVLVERAARNMLAWSERREQKNLVSHERMRLMRGNAPVRGGSSLAR